MNGNLSVVLSLSKGKYTSYSLLRIVRRINTRLLACGVKLCMRWVVSEMNIADKDSRAWAPPKAAYSHGDFRRTKANDAGVLEAEVAMRKWSV